MGGKAQDAAKNDTRVGVHRLKTMSWAFDRAGPEHRGDRRGEFSERIQRLTRGWGGRQKDRLYMERGLGSWGGFWERVPVLGVIRTRSRENLP